jgi:hypothetical protein
MNTNGISSNTLFKTCAQCGKKEQEMNRCAKCRLVDYCSKECQKVAWKTHKVTCKAPQNIIIEDRDFSGKPVQTFKAPIWDKKQIEVESATRNTSVFAKPRKNQPQKPVDPQTVGLKKNSKLIEQLLKQGEYNKIFDLIEAKPDCPPSTINWLQNAAEKGHVPCMFRLAILLTSKITAQDRSKVEEAVRWYHLGIHCTWLDIACNEDSTTEAAVGEFQLSLGSLLVKTLTESERKTYFANEYIQKIISSWTPKESHPSPQWVADHGLNIFMGVNSLKPQKEWLRLRQEKHEQLLKQLAEKSAQ